MNSVLVIGDTIIDEDVFCEAVGLSLESPTLKVNLKATKISLGGASNLASHLSKLGMKVDFFTTFSGKYMPQLEMQGFNLIGFKSNFECVKSRFWVSKGDAQYRLLQVNKHKSLVDYKDSCIKALTSLDLSVYEKVIVSDYRLGLVSRKLCNFVSQNSKYSVAASQLSDKKPNYHWFEKFNFIVCNEYESKFLENTRNTCITLGANGCKVNGKLFKGKKVHAKNTLGAGDAFLAAFCASEGDPLFANTYAAEYLEVLNEKH